MKLFQKRKRSCSQYVTGEDMSWAGYCHLLEGHEGPCQVTFLGFDGFTPVTHTATRTVAQALEELGQGGISWRR